MFDTEYSINHSRKYPGKKTETYFKLQLVISTPQYPTHIIDAGSLIKCIYTQWRGSWCIQVRLYKYCLMAIYTVWVWRVLEDTPDLLYKVWLEGSENGATWWSGLILKKL